LIKDLILYDVDELNLECRCDLGLEHFFRMTNTGFKTLLVLIAPTISKKDTSIGPAIPASVSEVEVPLSTDSFSLAKCLNRYLIFFSISSVSVPKETFISSKAS